MKYYGGNDFLQKSGKQPTIVLVLVFSMLNRMKDYVSDLNACNGSTDGSLGSFA